LPSDLPSRRPAPLDLVSMKMRRLLPAIGPFLGAPLIAEFLLGNLPVTMLGALVVLAPAYGEGAVLMRGPNVES
jgi:hypothetical protein